METTNRIVRHITLWGEFWQNKTNLKIFRWNILIIGIQIGYLVWKFGKLPTQIPIFFSLPWGERQLGDTGQMFILPIISLATMLINNLIAIPINEEKLLSKLLISFSLVVSFLNMIAVFMIIQIIL